ncbi:MAG: NAD(+) synthase [Fibromonadaceae bacterium]|jgi:NAD+ synthase (glutamine-hydrolysing)|nr:NAD(+) synthase [Fibromonadaceae bacterium]
MKIAIIQLNVKAGRFEHNFCETIKYISQAKEMGAELVVLPEMCLSGCFAGDKWLDIDFLELSKEYAEKLAEASQGITLIFGAVYEKRSCAYICEKGKLLCRYAKGHSQNIAEIGFGLKIGLEIGDDSFEGSGVAFIVNISASPFHRIFERKTPVVYANCCGCQNVGKNIVVFAGASAFYNCEGILLGEDSPNITSKEQVIQCAYCGMDKVLGFEPKYVFGLSGGIDSSLACALAVKALGKERVIGYNFPSEYNNEKTKKAAMQLAKNLGIEYNVVPIEGIQREVEKSLGCFPSIVKENIQAKIRCTDLLSNFAQIHGGVMTCNGNKLEIALGYCTLYGDTNGMFAPLGDLLKTEIFEIARGIEEIPRELVPNENLEFEEWQIYPSAELASGQRDPMKFGYHDSLLEFAMKGKISFSKAKELYGKGELFPFLKLPENLVKLYSLNEQQVFEQDLEWFFTRLNSMAFKRAQMPPILMMGKFAFGNRETI